MNITTRVLLIALVFCLPAASHAVGNPNLAKGEKIIPLTKEMIISKSLESSNPEILFDGKAVKSKAWGGSKKGQPPITFAIDLGSNCATLTAA